MWALLGAFISDETRGGGPPKDLTTPVMGVMGMGKISSASKPSADGRKVGEWVTSPVHEELCV